jgi:hypothetical protein
MCLSSMPVIYGAIPGEANGWPYGLPDHRKSAMLWRWLLKLSATSELLRVHLFAGDKRDMRVPILDFDYRLIVLSSFIVAIATYATLAVVHRMKSTRGAGWFAWLGGGASGIGIGIWSMHYLGLRILSLPVPTLYSSSVVYSILMTIAASGLSLLVVGGKNDSGRRVKEENRGLGPLKYSSITKWSD